MSHWTTVYRIARAAGIVLLLIVLICIFLPRYYTLRELQRRKAGMIEENNRLDAEIMDLKNKQERFATEPAFVERTAREMGMVKTDETLFKFTTEQSRTIERQP